MALTTNEIVETPPINGFIYKIEKLGAKKGRALMASLVRTLGPAFDGDDRIAKLCASLSDAQLEMVCDTLAEKTRFSPEANPSAEFFLKSEFDRHFSGRYGSMLLWLKACLEVNFGNFLQELGVDAGSLKDLLAVAMQAQSNPTSTAPTGASGAASLRASGG